MLVIATSVREARQPVMVTSGNQSNLVTGGSGCVGVEWICGTVEDEAVEGKEAAWALGCRYLCSKMEVLSMLKEDSVGRNVL